MYYREKVLSMGPQVALMSEAPPAQPELIGREHGDMLFCTLGSTCIEPMLPIAQDTSTNTGGHQGGSSVPGNPPDHFGDGRGGNTGGHDSGGTRGGNSRRN